MISAQIIFDACYSHMQKVYYMFMEPWNACTFSVWNDELR